MKLKPVEHTPEPGYPNKARWLAAPLAVGLTAAMALGLGGCDYVTRGGLEQTPADIETCTTDCPTTEYVIMGDMPVPVPETTDDYVVMGTMPGPEITGE